MYKGFAGLLISICVLGIANVGFTAPFITTEHASGCYGDPIQVQVLVDVVDPVEDFFFKLHFDQGMLQYGETWSQPPLTDDWAITCALTAPGEISVTGLTQYTGGTPIPAGMAGTILLLDFTVICMCDEGETSSFVFSELSQGFSGFSAVDGEFVYSCPASLTAHLVGGTASGYSGQTVVVPVSFIDAPNDVSAFGFHVEYCSDMLNYTGYQKGSLVTDWGNGNSDFGVNEPMPGSVIVGGWNLDSSIPAETSGMVVELMFLVSSGGGPTCELSLTNLVDDIAFWGTDPGYFEATPPPIPATGTAGLIIILVLFTSIFIYIKK